MDLGFRINSSCLWRCLQRFTVHQIRRSFPRWLARSVRYRQLQLPCCYRWAHLARRCSPTSICALHASNGINIRTGILRRASSGPCADRSGVGAALHGALRSRLRRQSRGRRGCAHGQYRRDARGCEQPRCRSGPSTAPVLNQSDSSNELLPG